MFPLRVRSAYSLLRGAALPETLCLKAVELGYSGLALTDRDNLYGLWDFLRACRKHGLRPIVGAELRAADGGPVVTCLVRDKHGFRNLCRLLSRRHAADRRSAGRESDLALQSSNSSPASGSSCADSSFALVDELSRLGQGLCLLCSDPVLLAELHGRGLDVVADLGDRPTETGRELRRFARKHRLDAVATPDCDLADPADAAIHQLLYAVRELCSYDRAGERLAKQPPRRLLAAAEYRDRFAVWPEVVDATERVAARCGFRGPEFGIVMPPWQGEGARGCEEAEAGSGPGTSAAAVLRDKAYRGARRRYGDDLGEPVVERMEHELKIIESMGFSSYFLVVQDIVHRPVDRVANQSANQAVDQAADLVTDQIAVQATQQSRRKKRRICGRGSGAASLVAYCLEITNVCPIKFNLYFERFLNPGRTDPPDIDIDFAWDERDEVLAGLFRDFAGHIAMVSNHVFFKPRMAIRETARAFGIPDAEISRLTDKIPWLSSRTEGSLQERLQQLPTMRDCDLGEPWPQLLDLAGRLLGLPRYLSVHPGGVVITPEPVESYCPLERAAKTINGQGVPLLQWEKDGVEEAGLVKIDLLGNRSLGVIRDCVAAVNIDGPRLDEERWQPEDDPATRLSVATGRTMGCFYIESPAMRLLEKKAGSGDFAELVIQSSLIRPAANDYVREYVRRLHGGAWQPLCAELRDVLSETYGLMVYQEDVSRVAVALAGFSPAQGDGLRKVMSKKDKELRLENYRQQFFSGCRERGIGEESIEQLWAMMMSFDGYSFCKPHSASYARVSYQAAYLKTHFPAEFMAAVISNGGGFYSTFGYVSEAKRLGLKLLPPDVRIAGRAWSGRDGALQVGLMAVRDLSAGCIRRLLAARTGRAFRNMADFFSRVRPADDEARALIHSGALDGLSDDANRTTQLWQWESYQHGSHSTTTLFGPVQIPAPALPPPEPLLQFRREYRALGFLCEEHPLRLLRAGKAAGNFDKVSQRGRDKINGGSRSTGCCIPLNRLNEFSGRRVEVAGWLLTGKLVSTRTGEAMEFLTFEDETAQVETTFFPGVYRRYAHILSTGRGYLLAGIVEEDYGALTLTVESVTLLSS